MLMDHACRRFRQLVVSQLGSIPVVWARYQGVQQYPWCVLQVIDGPVSRQEQRKWLRRRQVEWTINAGTAGDPVAARIGGRILNVDHTGDEVTTAELLEDQIPSHWTAVRVDNVWTISGPDVLAGAAYEGSDLSAVEIGAPFQGEVLRRDLTIQTTIWCQLDFDGRPARWQAEGCDQLAMKVQTALRQVVPDPYRVYIAPQVNLRAFDESYSDGREYNSASFDSQVSWVDYEEIFRYGFDSARGAAIEIIEAVNGTIELTDGVTTSTTDWSTEVP